ncbi:hypothetical protein BDN70DRAFT_886092 [Pholiota conissans]|uniref:GYF domain-containing protein n=1 Tax=Pholiota conissans TaxID=109636 RepID=A0A9P5YSL0_9AGAR|nr:hypothetical protein BDN70DRAFT_886092 [Pholiota conissans]
MSTTTMHFGPEWMRTKHQPLSRSSQPPPSPPPASTVSGSAVSTYSALVSATPPAPSEASDDVHPFRYSKEELVRIYQEGGKGGLGLEVERWEGVVREAGAEPVALREMSEAEKKLFAGPLNSELRRRPSQSTDFLSPLTTSGLDRPRLTHSTSSSANSPLRERFGALKRKDSAAGVSDPAVLGLPRKPSLSALQAPAVSPRDVSPRTRVGYTSSFDGVLNSGESWIARRRPVETLVKAGNVASRETVEIKASEIREENEEEQRIGSDAQQENQAYFLSSPHLRTEEPQQYDAAGVAPDNSGSVVPATLVPPNGPPNSNQCANNTHIGVGPPPGLVDLAAVEWSYKDPTGQIQGPFRADLMQKWYNDGYFSADLPMKRVLHDTHWTTVEELIQKANGENIFLSPLVSLAPNSRGNGSPLQTYPLTDSGFNEPFQPAPVRTLRTSTLESYLNGGSLASDSPSSSVGAFANPSPDPGVFGGRDLKPYYATTYGFQEHLSPYPDRRPLGHEYPNNTINVPQQGPSFGNYVSDRNPIYNGYTLSQQPVAHDPWMMSQNNIPSIFVGSRELPAHPDNIHNESMPRTLNQHIYPNGNLAGFNGHIPGANEVHHGYSQYEFTQQPGFPNNQDPAQFGSPAQPLHENSPGLNTLVGFRNLSLDSIASQSPAMDINSPIQSWNGLSKSSTPERISKSENIQSIFTSSIPLPAASVSQSPWNQELTFGIPREHEELAVVDSSLESTTNTPWNSNAVKTSSDTTTANGIHGNEHQETVEIVSKKSVSSIEQKLHSRGASDSAPASEISVSQSKLSAKGPQIVASVPQSLPVEAPSAVIPKIAWAKEEEGKKKKLSVPSISLREIQEAEAKKLESRKAAEREKERLARISVLAEAKDDIQPFTTSWGLPTSQTGSRASGTPREVPSAPVYSPATTPVWTTPLRQPVIKKTMKEIQEEEEGRKKLALKEVSLPVVAKRAYAETTYKVAASPPASTSSNAWTMVGPSGKTSAPVVSSPVRSLVQGSTQASASAISPLIRASSSPVQRTMASSALKTRPVVAKTEDFSDTPSHDFLKWLTDSLKGLNSSVNVEEILSMLLSFPLDPDASTIEIISDTIYSNSTTLDGRRFASEFIAKRKADARSKGASASGTFKPISIADVVKATPKAVQPEWGFKVVNKKKKGGRS